MALNDFFRINLPYGIEKNDKGEWLAFNREFVPIGWNEKHTGQSISAEDSYAELPIRTKYKNATEKILKQLIDETSAEEYDAQGNIKRIFLYEDGTNPVNYNTKENWDTYLKKIKILSQLNNYD